MALSAEFEYNGHEVVIAAVLVGGRWRCSYEIDTGLPTETMAENLNEEAAAIAAATTHAKCRIDTMKN